MSDQEKIEGNDYARDDLAYGYDRECCETYPYEDHAENCEVGWGKTCCYKLPKGKHTSDCTSNEAVFARADPEANAAKPAKWAEYRKQHGDSPHRRWVCVTSGELTPYLPFLKPAPLVVGSGYICEICKQAEALYPKEREAIFVYFLLSQRSGLCFVCVWGHSFEYVRGCASGVVCYVSKTFMLGLSSGSR